MAVSIDAVHYCVKRVASATQPVPQQRPLLVDCQIQSEYAPRISARCASSQLIKGRNHGAQRHARFCSRRRHLGILLLNISAFGLPKAAYLNPPGTALLRRRMHGPGHFSIYRPGEIPHAFCAAVWCWPANLLPRGRRWIQSRLTLLVLLGLFTVYCSGTAIFCWLTGWWVNLLAAGARCAIGKKPV